MTKTLNSKEETDRRLAVVEEINELITNSPLTGLLVTGSLAWGKNYAINEKSDIDFYFLAKKLEDYATLLKVYNLFPQKSVETIRNLINFTNDSIDTRSLKTGLGQFHGSVYFFLESDLKRLTKRLDSNKSTYFSNLRPHDFPQHKSYLSTQGNTIEFKTPLRKVNEGTELYIRTDPLILTEDGNLYGSIFLSHILYGEIYTDKNNALKNTRESMAGIVRSFLDKNVDTAYKQFMNYLPRSEKMNRKTKKRLFNLIWNV